MVRFCSLTRAEHTDLHISSRMLLWHEKSVEIPETGVHIAVSTLVEKLQSTIRSFVPGRRHLNEALIKENLSEFLSNLVQRVECSRCCRRVR
jgi:hypothetical protein